MEERNIGGIATMELKELILVWTCGVDVWVWQTLLTTDRFSMVEENMA